MTLNKLPETAIRYSTYVLLSAAQLLCAGCEVGPGIAINNRQNTPVTNAVEERLSAASPGAQTLLIPAVWPVAAATLAVDALVVHPYSVVDDALEDTRDALWDDFDWDTQYATECFTLPWRAVLTPIVFGFDWLGRAIFDVQPHGYKEATQAQAQNALARAAQELEENLPEEAGAALDEITPEDARRLTATQRDKYCVLRLRTARAGGDYTWFYRPDRLHFRRSLAPGDHSELSGLLEEMLRSDDGFTRLTAFRFACEWSAGNARQEYIRRQLGDPDQMIRFDAVNALRRLVSDEWSGFPPETLAAVNQAADKETDPFVRAGANEIVRAAAARKDGVGQSEGRGR